MPSSVHFSKATDAELSTCFISFFMQSGRSYTKASCTGAPFGLSNTPVDFHEEGNKGPASSILKSTLKKWSILACLHSCSSARRKLSFSKYASRVSGGTKKSPSSGLSARWALNSMRRRTEALECPSLSSLMLFQNLQPMSPLRVSSLTVDVDRSNFFRLRSTPFKPFKGNSTPSGTLRRKGSWMRKAESGMARVRSLDNSCTPPGSGRSVGGAPMVRRTACVRSAAWAR
mmetsp:Transcript_84938/g.182062  ORF Transcript_84938/g.182062 Transcript_84938/m.182062 type:complete len:230 (-) Transcript_84938:292-981(-)